MKVGDIIGAEDSRGKFDVMLLCRVTVEGGAVHKITPIGDEHWWLERTGANAYELHMCAPAVFEGEKLHAVPHD